MLVAIRSIILFFIHNLRPQKLKILLKIKKKKIKYGFQLAKLVKSRGVNVRPNPRTRHEPDTGFFGLGLGLNGFGL